MSTARNGAPPTNAGGADPYRPFRPRWGRVVPLVFSVVALIGFALAAIFIPGEAWTVLDRLFLFAVGAAIFGVLLRYGLIEARPSTEGIRVRNLFTTRTLVWEQIVRMQFGRGAPWVTLDLDDTDTVPVMAIQKADGAHGRAMASRLSALVSYHSAGGEDR